MNHNNIVFRISKSGPKANILQPMENIVRNILRVEFKSAKMNANPSPINGPRITIPGTI